MKYKTFSPGFSGLIQLIPMKPLQLRMLLQKKIQLRAQVIYDAIHIILIELGAHSIETL